MYTKMYIHTQKPQIPFSLLNVQFKSTVLCSSTQQRFPS